jgi:hypothetical protein
MAAMKFFPMSSDIEEIVREVMQNDTPYISTLGLNFKYLGTVKQPTVIKISKQNDLTEYLTEESQLIVITIFEEAFELLTNQYKRLIIANALNAIEYDSEKDRLTIKGNNGVALDEGIYNKYKEPVVLAVFSGEHAVRQIDEAKKEKRSK